MSEAELLKEIALWLYQHERVSEGRAMEIARIDRMTFRRFMAGRNIYHHYDVEDLEQDLATEARTTVIRRRVPPSNRIVL